MPLVDFRCNSNQIEFQYHTFDGAVVIYTCVSSSSYSLDPVLAKVKHSLLYGDPIPVGVDTEPFSRRQSELSLEDGCMLWGN